jgi:hypothetical protein
VVLLSFSHFEAKLKARTKDHTIRPFTPKRFKQLTDAKSYECWWRSRSPDGYKLYDAIPMGVPYGLSFERYTPKVLETQVLFVCTVYPALTVTDWPAGFTLKNRADKSGSIARVLDEYQFCALARRDGFDTPVDMVLHFVGEYGVAVFNMLFIGISFRAV